MTPECVETRTMAMIPTSRPALGALSQVKRKSQFWFPVVTGTLSLITGLPLVFGSQPIGALRPIATLMGIGLLMSLPSCCYYAWRYRAHFAPAGKLKQ
jgi:uncharacterized membrane protein HdeD (DUF308 family)